MHHSHIDRFSHQDSPVHRLDARAKLIAVLAYTAVLVSFDRYALAVLVPLAVAPLGLLWFAHVPMAFAMRRVVILSPFIAMLAILSPVYDRVPVGVVLGPWRFEIAAGWVAAGGIAARFALGVLALTGLTASTPFPSLLEALRRLRLPRLLVMQLGFLYRYLFVLLDEAMRIRRGRDFRGAHRAGPSRRLSAVGGIIGSLFVRTLERSERIQTAMACRGYRGEPHSLDRLRFGSADGIFLAAFAAYLLFCRFVYPALIA